jgi:hypothetical protein
MIRRNGEASIAIVGYRGGSEPNGPGLIPGGVGFLTPEFSHFDQTVWGFNNPLRGREYVWWTGPPVVKVLRSWKQPKTVLILIYSDFKD